MGGHGAGDPHLLHGAGHAAAIFPEIVAQVYGAAPYMVVNMSTTEIQNEIIKTDQGYEAIERKLGYGYIGTFASEAEARAALRNCDHQYLDSEIL